MKSINRTTSYLKYLIQSNQIDTLLEHLKEISSSTMSSHTNREFENDITIISRKHNKFKSDNLRGLLSFSEKQLEINIIIDKLIQIIDKYSQKSYSILIDTDTELTYENFKPIIDELADELANNYYSVSFGDKNKEIKPSNILKNTNIENSIPKKRNILIVGAGATQASCPYIPFGSQLRFHLEHNNEVYQKHMKYYNRLKREEISFDPEDYLAELNRHLSPNEKKDLIKKIAEIYNKKYLPTHTYEIIAHMLKHQFIDIVINFNFDELLDQAITEEFGDAPYINVIDESDCKDFNSIFIDGRLKTPIYIKIHGTASKKSSLKFTRDHHKLEVSEEMRLFIKKWLLGYMSDDESNNKIPVNIISLGFNIERSDFYTFFMDEKEKLQESSKFFQINWKKELDDKIYNLTPYYIQEGGSNIPRYIKLETWNKINREGKDQTVPAMADFLLCLWHNVENKFHTDYKPRSIARHKIIADIFYTSFKHGKREDYKENPNACKTIDETLSYYFKNSPMYYFERVVIEVAILIAKNKGIIEPREAIKEDRIKRFYDLYKNAYFKQDKNSSNLNLPSYCKKLFTLNDIYVKIFRMEEKFSFSNHLLNLSSVSDNEYEPKNQDNLLLNDLCNFFKENILPINILKSPNNKHIVILYRLLKNKIFKETRIYKELLYQNKNNILKKLSENLDQIAKGFTYDIKANFKDESMFTLESLQQEHIMHTNLALSWHFSNTIINRSREWNTLLLISERGKFISKPLENPEIKDLYRLSLSQKNIIIVACYEAVSEHLNEHNLSGKKLAQKYIDSLNLPGINITILFLPYWRHHHHTAIFLNVDKFKDDNENNSVKFKLDSNTEVSVIKSLYYFKQGFSNKINPIMIPTESADIQTLQLMKNDQNWLLQNFIAHYIKAIIYTEDNLIIPSLSSETNNNENEYKGVFLKLNDKTYSSTQFLKNLADWYNDPNNVNQ